MTRDVRSLAGKWSEKKGNKKIAAPPFNWPYKPDISVFFSMSFWPELPEAWSHLTGRPALPFP